MPKIAIIGGGTTWGATLGVVLARKRHDIFLLTRSDEEADKMRRNELRQLPLPRGRFPARMEFTASPSLAITEAKVQLLKDVSHKTSVSYVDSAWLRHQAEKLQRGDVLLWETAPPSAVVPNSQASENAQGSPVPPQKLR